MKKSVSKKNNRRRTTTEEPVEKKKINDVMTDERWLEKRKIEFQARNRMILDYIIVDTIKSEGE